MYSVLRMFRIQFHCLSLHKHYNFRSISKYLKLSNRIQDCNHCNYLVDRKHKMHILKDHYNLVHIKYYQHLNGFLVRIYYIQELLDLHKQLSNQGSMELYISTI